MKQDFSNFYQQFMPKSRLNNSFINKQNEFYDKKYFTTNEPRKEISSDALDNLFDFNIGKELEPEPDIMIDNNKQENYNNSQSFLINEKKNYKYLLSNYFKYIPNIYL